eukprot:SAG31_NODE_7858_length_1581_cov_47.520243_1_plen_93_part_00
MRFDVHHNGAAVLGEGEKIATGCQRTAQCELLEATRRARQRRHLLDTKQSAIGKKQRGEEGQHRRKGTTCCCRVDLVLQNDNLFSPDLALVE